MRQRALGDPDAVSFGDYHLANHVGWALFGHDITDEEMAEALEPYRPQRGRAAALAVCRRADTAAEGPADERADPPADARHRASYVADRTAPGPPEMGSLDPGRRE